MKFFLIGVLGWGLDVVGLGCGGFSCTCHMPSDKLQVTSRTTSPCFFTVMVVKVNVSVHPSSHIFPIQINTPDWSWGKICDVLALFDNKGLSFSSAL